MGILIVILLVAGTFILLGRIKSNLPRSKSWTNDKPVRSYQIDPNHLRAVLKYGIEMDVVGEAQANLDGTSRRKIIAKLANGEMLGLVREPKNRYDENAVRVDSIAGTIGYISRENAAWLSKRIDADEQVIACIQNIAGGTEDKPDYGVWMRVLFINDIPDNATV